MNDPILAIKQLILKSYKYPCSLKQLCEQIGQSYHTLRKQFRQQEGISMSEYCQKLRIEETERQLQDVDIAICTIVYEMGFYDEAHFSNWFKKIKGISPNAYREQMNYRKKIGD